MLIVCDWGKLYENNRTRDMKKTEWVPIPNRMDGLGYSTLVDHPNGAAHFGAWVAILEICSRQDTRGTFPQEGAAIPQALARISRLPAELFAEAIPRLVNIGWIQLIQSVGTSPQEGAENPQEPASDRLRAHARTSVPFPSIPFSSVPSSEEEKNDDELPFATALIPEPVVDSATDPRVIFDGCCELYRAAGVPVPQSQRDTITRLILGVEPPARRLRIPRYIAWNLQTGRWPNPGKTMAFKTLMEGTNWDVDVVERTLPNARASPRDSAIDDAVRRLREERNAANGN